MNLRKWLKTPVRPLSNQISNNDNYSEKLRLGIEDLRLWRMKKENTSMLLLEEGEDKTLDMLNIKSGTSLLIEVRTHTHTHTHLHLMVVVSLKTTLSYSDSPIISVISDNNRTR